MNSIKRYSTRNYDLARSLLRDPFWPYAALSGRDGLDDFE